MSPLKGSVRRLKIRGHAGRRMAPPKSEAVLDELLIKKRFSSCLAQGEQVAVIVEK